MSEEDNFLARWSRRKVAVQRTEQTQDSETGFGTGPAAPPFTAEGEQVRHGKGSDPECQGQWTPPVPAAEPERPEPLPRIEDLTAESDVSAFLRAGVPPALRMAALRRAWSLDPAIRDYVGPAEYAYDFNDPASIPGFGSGPGWDLKTAAEYAQKIVNPSRATEGNAGFAEPAERLAQPDLHPVRVDAGTPPAPEKHDSPEPARTAERLPAEEASPQAGEPPADSPGRARAARHGGALPR